MTRWIALFRGINVGGNNLLPMKKLVSELEALNLKNVKTYIQSGNIVFDATAKSGTMLATSIGKRIEQKFGFLPHVLLLSAQELQSAIDANPFPKAAEEPKSLHFFFLAQPAAKLKLAALDAAKSATESYQITDRVFYLHAPNGIGRSKLAATAEKHLGVPTTARNYRTVETLLALALEE